jgi:hypothetical protein
MRPPFYTLFLVTATLVFLSSCGKMAPQKKPTSEKTDSVIQKDPGQEKIFIHPKNKVYIDPSGQEIFPKNIDTSILYIDTLLFVDEYKIAITKQKFDAQHKLYSADDLSSIYILLHVIKNDSIVYRESFDANQFAEINTTPDKSVLYITLVNFSGGSGYTATVYQLDLKGGKKAVEALSYSELTSVMFSADKKELIVMQGIWEMSDDSDESHFSDHVYEISVVDLTNNKFERKTMGTTRNKYPSAEIDFSSEKLLKQIHAKEPQAFKGINLDRYLIQ